MPTYNDETLHDRYAREHADHMARLAKLAPEQIAKMELSLHNALAEIGQLRAQLHSLQDAGEAVEYQQLSRYGNWDRIEKVNFELGMLSDCPERFRALYTRPADPDAVPVPVPVPRELADEVAALRAFANEIVSGAFEGGSFDGGDIQDIGVKHGLLRIEQRDAECGEICECREYGFPSDCYRKTELLAKGVE